MTTRTVAAAAGICVLAVISTGRSARADNDLPLVTLSLSAGEVELGQPFFAYIEVSTAAGTQVSLPKDLVLGKPFEEIGRKLTVTHPDGRDLHTFELRLMAFELGELEIPEMSILYAADAGPSEVRTATSRITVRSILAGGDFSVRDVAPVAVIRRDLRRLYWSAGIVLTLLLLSVVAVALARRAPRSAKTADLPGLPPLQRARQRFEAIEARLASAELSDRRPVYVEMSETVREYLGSTFSIPSLDATTAEIESALEGVDVVRESRGTLVDWLRSCDLVKFAGYGASSDEARQALYQARSWVEQSERARKRAERSAEANRRARG